MAVKSDRTVRVPRSTGAVQMPADPVTHEQLADNESTDAVPYESPGTTKMEHLDLEQVVVVPTPSEPVTMSVSWLAENDKLEQELVATGPQAKVIKAPAQSKPSGSSQPVQTA